MFLFGLSRFQFKIDPQKLPLNKTEFAALTPNKTVLYFDIVVTQSNSKTFPEGFKGTCKELILKYVRIPKVCIPAPNDEGGSWVSPVNFFRFFRKKFSFKEPLPCENGVKKQHCGAGSFRMKCNWTDQVCAIANGPGQLDNYFLTVRTVWAYSTYHGFPCPFATKFVRFTILL